MQGYHTSSVFSILVVPLSQILHCRGYPGAGEAEGEDAAFEKGAKLVLDANVRLWPKAVVR